jgi:hypothetical protein
MRSTSTPTQPSTVPSTLMAQRSATPTLTFCSEPQALHTILRLAFICEIATLGLYAQWDSWRVRSDLTHQRRPALDVIMPWWENTTSFRRGLMANNPALPRSTRGLLVAGDPWYTQDSSLPPALQKFCPRIGFAYSPKFDRGFWSKLIGVPAAKAASGPVTASSTRRSKVYLLELCTPYRPLDSTISALRRRYLQHPSSPLPPDSTTDSVSPFRFRHTTSQYPIPTPQSTGTTSSPSLPTRSFTIATMFRMSAATCSLSRDRSPHILC